MNRKKKIDALSYINKQAKMSKTKNKPTKSKSGNLKRKEFDEFQETTLGLFEKQNKTLERLIDRDKSKFLDILKLFKGLLLLIILFFLVAIFWDEVVQSWLVIFSFINSLYSQTSPDTRWQTLIIVPFTVILTLISKYFYDKFKEKKN